MRTPLQTSNDTDYRSNGTHPIDDSLFFEEDDQSFEDNFSFDTDDFSFEDIQEQASLASEDDQELTFFSQDDNLFTSDPPAPPISQEIIDPCLHPRTQDELSSKPWPPIPISSEPASKPPYAKAFTPTDLTEAKSFIKIFNPDENQFRRLYSTSISDPVWFYHSTDPSKTRAIPYDRFSYVMFLQHAINGKSLLHSMSWFSADPTIASCIDLDFHNMPAVWLSRRRFPIQELVDKYNLILSRLHFYPSFIAQSPRGLHLFFILSIPLPLATIKQRLNLFLKGIDGWELLPTPTLSIRVPCRKWILDPSSFMRLFRGSKQKVDFSTFHRVPSSLLFKEPHIQSHDAPLKDAQTIAHDTEHPASTTDLSSRDVATHSSSSHLTNTQEKSKQQSPLPSPHLCSFDPFQPFKDHKTNTHLFLFVGAHKARGLTVDQIFPLVLAHVAFSRNHGYTRYLDTEPCTEDRIRRAFKKYKVHRKQLPDISNIPIDDNPLSHLFSLLPSIEEISPAAIRKFLGFTLRWDTAHTMRDSIPGFLNYFRRYPNYDSLAADFFFPLPSEEMEHWCKRYKRIIEALLNLGILEKHPTEYSFKDHRCRYYRLHLPTTSPATT
jgi:hypothetical protein